MNDIKSNQHLLWAVPLAVIAIVATFLATAPAQASLDDTDAIKSEEYTADIQLAQLSVALTEQNAGTPDPVVRAETDAETGVLTATDLLNGLTGGDPLAFGKSYTENLAALNDGTHDEYVRVVINKYWLGNDGYGDFVKNTELSPSLIKLGFNENEWIVVDGDKTGSEEEKEQVILYSKNPIPAKENNSRIFMETLTVDPSILKNARAYQVGEAKNNGTVKTEYKYETYKIGLDVEVSAVQVNSAEDAIKSAWGVDMAELGINKAA